MIALSARCLARAWLAVQLASSNDEGRASTYRAVHIEEYAAGVELVATDGYWLAHCWVPAYDLLEHITAEVPAGHATERDIDDFIGAATVCDTDYRVRDLMRHLLRTLAPKDALDMPVTVDLNAVLDPDPDNPTLLPEWEKRAAVFELVTRERVPVEVLGDDWFDWRRITDSYHQPYEADSWETVTTVTQSRLDRLAKVARTVGADVTIDWRGAGKARWWTTMSDLLEHRPEGVFTYKDATGPATAPAAGDEGSPDPVPGSPNTVTNSNDDLDRISRALDGRR
jgi:hypothetical protein